MRPKGGDRSQVYGAFRSNVSGVDGVHEPRVAVRSRSEASVGGKICFSGRQALEMGEFR